MKHTNEERRIKGVKAFLATCVLIATCYACCLFLTGCQTASDKGFSSFTDTVLEEGLDTATDLLLMAIPLEVDGLSRVEGIESSKSGEVLDEREVPSSKRSLSNNDEALAEEADADIEDASGLANSDMEGYREPRGNSYTRYVIQGFSELVNIDAEYEADTLLISPADGASVDDIAQAIGVDAMAISQLKSGIYQVELPKESDLQDAIDRVRESGVAEGAQPDFVYYLQDEVEEQLQADELNDSPLLDSDTETDAGELPIDGESEFSQPEATEDVLLEGGVEDPDDDSPTEAHDMEDEPDEGATRVESEEPLESSSGEEGEESALGERDSSFGELAVEPSSTSAVPSQETLSSSNEHTDERNNDLESNTEDEPSTTESTESENESSSSSSDESDEDALRIEVNDPLAASQWALESIHAPEAWSLLEETKPNPVSVAVIDEGFQLKHEDLQSAWITKDVGIACYNAALDVEDTYTVMDPMDSQDGHGTHVAGIVAARANNSLGVAGVSLNQKIVPIKVFDKSVTATTSTLTNAYAYIAEHQDEYNIRVVNMSVGVFGSTTVDKALQEAVDNAYEHGIVTVCSAGNQTGAKKVPNANYPSDYDPMVSVINLRELKSANASGDVVARATNSNYNQPGERTKDICAPGTNIWSAYPYQGSSSERYRSKSGTSMAAPCVSGVLAMMFALNPALSAQQAVDALYKTANDLGEEGFDEETGWGEVDALAALAESSQVTGTIDTTGKAVLPRTELSDGDPQIVWSVAAEDSTSTSGVESSSTAAATSSTPISSSTSGSSVEPSRSGGSSSAATSKVPISDASISKPAAQYVTGGSIEPHPAITYKGRSLKKDVDYTLSYLNNKKVGAATITVKGKGSFTGRAKVTFRIIHRPLYVRGASQMPVNSTAQWNLRYCTMKVVAGKTRAKVSDSGAALKAKKPGTVKVAIFDEAGVTVKTYKVKVYNLAGTYLLQSAKKPDLYLGAKGTSKLASTPIVAGTTAGDGIQAAQRIKFIPMKNTYKMKVTSTRKNFAVKDASVEAYARIVQEPPISGKTKATQVKSQKWKIVVDRLNRLSFINAKSGLTMALKGAPAPGSKVVQREGTGILREKWVLTR